MFSRYDRARLLEVIQRYLDKNYPHATIIDGGLNSFPRNVTLGEYVLAHVMVDVTETERERVTARIADYLGRAYIFRIRGDVALAEGQRRMARDLGSLYIGKIKRSAARIGLDLLENTDKEVRCHLLDSQESLGPEALAILRTELRLPSEPATSPTKAAPATAIALAVAAGK